MFSKSILHMKSKNRPMYLVHRLKLLAWMTGFLICEIASGIEPIILPEPQPELTTEAQQDMPNEMQVFIPSGATQMTPTEDPFRLGPVVFRPHVDYNFLYGTGIQVAPSNHVGSIVQTLSSGMLFNLGRHWTLDYTPSLTFYSDHQLHSSVNHSASLTGQTGFGDWTFSLSQTFNYSSTPDTQTASQAAQQAYGTSITADYSINNKLSAIFSLGQSLQFVSGLANSQNSQNWSANAGLNYRVWPRFNIGVNLGGSFVNTDSGDNASPNAVNESFQFNANWRATDKISVQLNAGFEDQQYIGLSGQDLIQVTLMDETNIVITTNHIAPASDLLSPVFGVSIQYQPFHFTQISLNASRNISPSLFLNEVTENTTIGINLNQRLLRKYFINLSAGYNFTQFTPSVEGENLFGTSNREDRSYNVGVRLTRVFFKRGNFSVFYSYNQNSSSASAYSYASEQVGVEVGYRY
jgi:hypothetical protein